MGVWSMNAQQLDQAAERWADRGVVKLSSMLMGILSAPAVIWLGTTLWAMNGEQAKLAARMDVLTERIEQQMSGRYRDTDAIRDFAKRDQKDMEHDSRIKENRDSIRENSDRIRAIETSRALAPR